MPAEQIASSRSQISYSNYNWIVGLDDLLHESDTMIITTTAPTTEPMMMYMVVKDVDGGCDGKLLGGLLVLGSSGTGGRSLLPIH